MEQPEKPLHTFRADLQLFPGPSDFDGSPTYNLFDPVRAQYYKINWAESLALKLHRPGMTLTQLAHEIETHSTLKVDPEELKRFFMDAAVNNLLNVGKTSEALLAEAEKQKTGWFKWLLYHYLYIRIPLINPDKFLARTLHYVMPLLSLKAYFFYSTIIFLGLVVLVTHFEEFIHTFTYFFNFQGFIIYALAITSVKIIHEFGHAYVAKYTGIYVPTMGIALIVFWPVLFTDVTDSWRLAKRSQRLAISFAGVAVESTIAGLCTVGWALTPPGLLQSAFFVICSVTWISTLLVNLNPALRFDGYYMLCDILSIDNLQARAFAFTRWQLRKWLLGIDVDPPEDNLTPSRKYLMMIYTLYTWTWRLFLYTAIAVFVYLKFTKMLGIFLFIMEIAIFILWPLFSEIQQLNRLRPVMTWNRRSILFTTFLGLLAAWFILPWPHEEAYVAITEPEDQQVVYIPYNSTAEEIYVKRGERVLEHQPLVKLRSVPLFAEIAQAEVEKAGAEKEMLIAAESEETRQMVREKENTIAALDARLNSLRKIQEQLTLRAELNGMIYSWDETLRVGQSLAKDEVIGKIANFTSLEVVAYVPERYVHDIVEGQKVRFRIESTHEAIDGIVHKINPIRSQVLIHPQLASIHKGDLPVIKDPKEKDVLRLVESYYTVHVTLKDPPHSLLIGQKGSLDVRGPWRSKAMTLFRYIQSLFWREVSL